MTPPILLDAEALQAARAWLSYLEPEDVSDEMRRSLAAELQAAADRWFERTLPMPDDDVTYWPTTTDDGSDISFPF